MKRAQTISPIGLCGLFTPRGKRDAHFRIDQAWRAINSRKMMAFLRSTRYPEARFLVVTQLLRSAPGILFLFLFKNWRSCRDWALHFEKQVCWSFPNLEKLSEEFLIKMYRNEQLICTAIKLLELECDLVLLILYQ